MSVQSESGRKDYDKSDHAPGTKMAGDVVRPPEFNTEWAEEVDQSNKKAMKESNPTPADWTNVDMSFLKKKMLEKK